MSSRDLLGKIIQFVLTTSLGGALLMDSGCSQSQPINKADPVKRAAASERRPNVLLIMTDDQGWGDVGFHGNPHLKTPHLDRLAAQSAELTQFHVCPVCSPTRASLLTGRYNYRTGAIDTYLGRSTMAGEEMTLAEMFSAASWVAASSA